MNFHLLACFPLSFFHNIFPPNHYLQIFLYLLIQFALLLILLQSKFKLLVVSERFYGLWELTASVSYHLEERLLINKGLRLLPLSDCWLEKNLFRSVGLQLVDILAIKEPARL